MKQFVRLSKLVKGDRVSLISPSDDLAGKYPWVTDLGVERLKEVFGLEAKEYPTTRSVSNSLQDRARDIMAAFADTETKAVIATLGGNDQIKLLKYLDHEVLRANPKPFFGFSDNTHLQIYLWNLGIPSYYGGCLMTQFAMQGGMHNFTLEYLKRALFENGEFELKHSPTYNDVNFDWSTEENLQKARPMEPNDPWVWDGSMDVEGRLWGGCVESMVVQSATAKYMPKTEDLDDTVLFLEVADGNTGSWVPEYVLSGFGERGWLDRFQAVLIGRTKAWEFNLDRSSEQKAAFRKEQQDTILKAIRQYNNLIPVIQNLDFGHTDPQAVLPNGGKVRINSKAKKIFLTY